MVTSLTELFTNPLSESDKNLITWKLSSLQRLNSEIIGSAINSSNSHYDNIEDLIESEFIGLEK